jgi:NitT/TauT family transport system substrate-binding protein
MDQVTMEAAFRRGDLDAMVTYPPASVRLARDFGARTLFSSAAIPGDIVDVLVVEREVIDQRRADVAALLRGFDRARRFGRDQPAEAAAIMARREGLTPQEFAHALQDGVVLVADADQARYLASGGDLERILRHADSLLRRAGELTRPPRLDAIVDDRFLPAGPR